MNIVVLPRRDNGLPLGIDIGVAVSCYGSFFFNSRQPISKIGSPVKLRLDNPLSFGIDIAVFFAVILGRYQGIAFAKVYLVKIFARTNTIPISNKCQFAIAIVVGTGFLFFQAQAG
nr:hypothetical protein [uncultured Cardiobacterium sp.]